jgi:hypothetical protein
VRDGRVQIVCSGDILKIANCIICGKTELVIQRGEIEFHILLVNDNVLLS